MRFGAFVITLNRPHLLKRTLQLLLSQTRPPDHVLVVDNGQSKETQSVVAAFSPVLITYHAMSENVGPAGAAAYALDQLSRQGYEWIYWGDDDDPPPSSDTIERLLEVAASTGEDTGAVGVVGAMWDWTKGEIRRIPDEALTGIIGVDMIAGGHQLILRRKMVASVGLPDSRLFFGLEETEYCLRIRAAGYRLLVNGDLMRESRTRSGHLGWKPRRSNVPHRSNDGIWRQYYSTRNYIFAMIKTFGRPDLARRELLKGIGRACLSWARGPRYGCAFTAMQLRGIVDGYLGRMGRTVTPVPKYRTEGATAATSVVRSLPAEHSSPAGAASVRETKVQAAPQLPRAEEA